MPAPQRPLLEDLHYAGLLGLGFRMLRLLLGAGVFLGLGFHTLRVLYAKCIIS